MSEEFTIVQSKKKHRKFGKSAQVKCNRASSPAEFDRDKILKRINYCETELEISEYFQTAIDIIKTAVNNHRISEIICLGIGSISESLTAKYQLAFINLVQRNLNIQSINFFDPLLSAGEQEVLKALKHTVLSENKEGKYIAESPTLFYLPHCPKQLTNNLLFSNWDPKYLANIFLISNSFQRIITKTPERFLRPSANFILEVNPFVSEVEIENSFELNTCFNDTSIHSFTPTKLDTASANLWINPSQPTYIEEDLEIVLNGSKKFKTTDEQLCKVKDEMHFLGQTYLCYLQSARNYKRINDEYKGAGERTVEATAKLPLVNKTKMSQKKEFFNIHNNLTSIPCLLINKNVLIFLRNESWVAGKIVDADGLMNIFMEKVVYCDQKGLQYKLDNYGIRNRQILYIQIPESIDLTSAIKDYLDKLHTPMNKSTKRTFKIKRAQMKNQETVNELKGKQF
ncbi:CLUMA_CG004562, isoform A [Clunio marinus]|uniref:CLUMA_CG004562, isoform A n=1 Tax=Clunio marinus TaxID=568069 RepID=A0A1J1HS12_9DIPT|nr:CLUMA_CG004562, isoform A [Clunio marinus]